MMFKSQIKIFRKFFEKVALRAILRYNVLTHLWSLENVVPFVLKYINMNVHNYWWNIHRELIQNVKKIITNFIHNLHNILHIKSLHQKNQKSINILFIYSIFCRESF